MSIRPFAPERRERGLRGVRHLTPRVGVAAATLVVLLALLGHFWRGQLTHRNAAIEAGLADARRALLETREAAARHWAPDAFESARTAFQTALVAARIEQTRWWPFGGLEALAQLESARRAAGTVAATARARAHEAATDADERIEGAAIVLARAERLASTLYLDPGQRQNLQRARLSLAEAQRHRARGAAPVAATRADAARELAIGVTGRARDAMERYRDASRLQEWRAWVEQTIAWSRRAGRPAVVVDKAHHLVVLYAHGREVRRYRAELGYNWIADKLHAGDGATPEGRYRVTERKDRGTSAYHRALLLDYPNPDDRRTFARARRLGTVPAATGIGGLIEIHGEGDRGRDWTRGCVALSNGDMDHLYAHVSVGTPVTIVGTAAPGALDELVTSDVDAASGR